MENPRPAKVAVVNEVRDRLSSSDAAILTEYRGLNVSELATLRRSLREAGGQYKIYKNTLVRFAVRELGLEELEEMLLGPTAIAFVDGDAAAVAKSLRDFARGTPNLGTWVVAWSASNHSAHNGYNGPVMHALRAMH